MNHFPLHVGSEIYLDAPEECIEVRRFRGLLLLWFLATIHIFGGTTPFAFFMMSRGWKMKIDQRNRMFLIQISWWTTSCTKWGWFKSYSIHQRYPPKVSHGIWKMAPSNRRFLLDTIIFRSHVNLRWWFELFFFSPPNPGEMIPIWLDNIFQVGWNNHLNNPGSGKWYLTGGYYWRYTIFSSGLKPPTISTAHSAPGSSQGANQDLVVLYLQPHQASVWRSVMRNRWLHETWHWVGGNSNLFCDFHPELWGRWNPFWRHIFQKGKHQLDDFFMFTSGTLPQIRNDFVSFWNRTELDWMIAMSPGNIMEDFGR